MPPDEIGRMTGKHTYLMRGGGHRALRDAQAMNQIVILILDTTHRKSVRPVASAYTGIVAAEAQKPREVIGHGT